MSCTNIVREDRAGPYASLGQYTVKKNRPIRKIRKVVGQYLEWCWYLPRYVLIGWYQPFFLSLHNYISVVLKLFATTTKLTWNLKFFRQPTFFFFFFFSSCESLYFPCLPILWHSWKELVALQCAAVHRLRVIGWLKLQTIFLTKERPLLT